jgi:hypothetical protein
MLFGDGTYVRKGGTHIPEKRFDIVLTGRSPGIGTSRNEASQTRLAKEPTNLGEVEGQKPRGRLRDVGERRTGADGEGVSVFQAGRDIGDSKEVKQLKHA